jgi:hypothetical protein
VVAAAAVNVNPRRSQAAAQETEDSMVRGLLQVVEVVVEEERRRNLILLTNLNTSVMNPWDLLSIRRRRGKLKKRRKRKRPRLNFIILFEWKNYWMRS